MKFVWREGEKKKKPTKNPKKAPGIKGEGAGNGSGGNEFKGEMKFKVQFLFTPRYSSAKKIKNPPESSP